MFITGPQVIKQVTGETVSADHLGGPAAQMNRSGVVHLIAEDDEGALLQPAVCRPSCRRTTWRTLRGWHLSWSWEMMLR